MKRYIGADLRKVDAKDLETFVIFSFDTDDIDNDGHRIMEHKKFHSKFKEVKNYNEELR